MQSFTFDFISQQYMKLNKYNYAGAKRRAVKQDCTLCCVRVGDVIFCCHFFMNTNLLTWNQQHLDCSAPAQLDHIWQFALYDLSSLYVLSVTYFLLSLKFKIMLIIHVQIIHAKWVQKVSKYWNLSWIHCSFIKNKICSELVSLYKNLVSPKPLRPLPTTLRATVPLWVT